MTHTLTEKSSSRVLVNLLTNFNAQRITPHKPKLFIFCALDVRDFECVTGPLSNITKKSINYTMINRLLTHLLSLYAG